jgi:sensor histidine kinase YesM
MENITINQEDISEAIQSVKITFFLNTLIAIFISLIITESSFIEQFLAAQSIGLTIVAIIQIANILFPILVLKFKYQYFFMPFPALIATLIGHNFLGKYTTFIELYCLVFIITLPALFVFQYRNSDKLAKLSLQQEKQKRTQSEQALLESKLLLLQAQINPHFLFNTLANIDAYIDDFPDKAKKLLSDYTQFLRHSLKTTQQNTGLLGDEVALIDAYMAIQQTRFPNVKFSKEIELSLLQHPLPPLLIQPLIENALIHGLAPQGNKGLITLRIKQQNEQLIIEVKDDGVGIDINIDIDIDNSKSRNKQSNGVALKNIQSRLQLANKEAHLVIQANTKGGTNATITQPC